MKSLNVVKQMREGAFNGDLNHIYCAQTLNLSYYKNRLERTVRDFEYTFGKDRDVYVFSAPGRCEICGNHTDHQNGKVLAASINLDIIAVVSKNDDRKINLKSNGYRLTTIDLDGDPIERKGTTAALIRGISQRFKELGHIVGGFDCFTSSDVLVGSGLSSSASFEILIGTIINHLYCKLKKSPLEIAKIGQYAENKYFGKPSGLMDQTACSVGGFIKMDFESKQPKIESLTFDLDSLDYSLCIVDTHASHSGLTYEYAKIPSDMRAVAKYFKKDVLREVDEAVFYQEIPNIRKRLGDRPLLRAMHFFNEEKRVDQAFEALKKDDFDEFLQVILRSGRSSFCYLQNVYLQSRINEQGLSVALALCERFFVDKKGAYRIHGGGFAGTIEAFVPNAFLESFKVEMERVFGRNSCYILKIRPVGGIKLIS